MVVKKGIAIYVVVYSISKMDSCLMEMVACNETTLEEVNSEIIVQDVFLMDYPTQEHNLGLDDSEIVITLID